ncbi:hypothetical protein [Burkholderia cenocepacia]|uniref:hypothetical protein n=1 Tax=Burkholderia cenocepacia TaxID=95486 RepID=UPI00076C017B|nr:hypothetical protein [Burkholderia cenocepacia]KWU26305.1 hypothetical protein AS149_25270 [Burkholderia cenocepacia]
MNTNEILLANNFLPVAAASLKQSSGAQTEAMLGTVLANMAYFGFAPSVEALRVLREMPSKALGEWWSQVNAAFRAVTGDDRNMGHFVVYKNFPREVLDMDQGRYWLRQILMYVGAPNEWFTEPVEQRPKLEERLKLRVLQPAAEDTFASIFKTLVASRAKWSDAQAAHAQHLLVTLKVDALDLSAFGFKVNGISLIAANQSIPYAIADATDVLRLAASLSEQDVTLREIVKFKRFNRAERRRLLAVLDGTNNLAEDVGLRPELFKKLFSQLHPGDFRFENVKRVYDAVYKGALQTFAGKVEAGLVAKNEAVLALVAKRPGDFARRLHKLYAVFGHKAVNAFVQVVPELNTLALLKLRAYVSTIDGRQSLIYPPGGVWSRAQIVVNEKTPFGQEARAALLAAMDAELGARLKAAIPEGANVDLRAVEVKLQTNDQQLAPYGRGTVFTLPDSAKYVRTASFWEARRAGNVWYDNGWTFFGEGWEALGTCTWDENQFGGLTEVGAVFSGDPTNSKDLQGRACQMIDLNLDGLAARGVRYAVWGVLAYSRIAFADANDVLATLQWGEDAAAGKLYEPARAQMVFPLKGNEMSKYVAYLDVKERKLVYMDASFRADTHSATRNQYLLGTQMPSFVEYLNALPSVADLFCHAGEGTMPVLYNDEGHSIEKGARAYVFQPTNPENSFSQVEPATIL